MKTVNFKDARAVAEATERLLDYFRDPEHTPMCIMCGERHSWFLMVYTPEGIEQTQIFGLCEHCWPKENGVENIPQEKMKEIIDKVKEKMEKEESVLHLKRKEWVC